MRMTTSCGTYPHYGVIVETAGRMRALAIVHQADAGPGVFKDAIEGSGCELETWKPPSQPQPADVNRYDAVLTFGAAANPDQDADHPWMATERAFLADLIDRGTPTLAVCLGAELLAQAAGGEARRAAEPEIGWRQIALTEAATDDPLLSPLAASFEAFQWHSYESVPPAEAVPLATSDGRLAAFRVADRAWGIQFHAEVTVADVEHWIRDYRTDPDAVRIGLDAEPLLAETRGKIEDSNRLGTGVCERFLDLAAGTEE